MPMARLKTLSKDILLYGAGNALYSVIQFFCMPLLIKGMTMDEVAYWNILLPTGVLLSAIVTFGMDSAIVRFIIDRNESQKRLIFSSGLYFIGGLALIVSAAFWLFSRQVIRAINIPQAQFASYWILLCWLPGVIVSQYCQNWFKYTFRRSTFFMVIASQSAVYLLLVTGMKVFDTINLPNTMLASLISVWISALLGLFFTRSMIEFRMNRDILAQMLRYGAPFMFMAFGCNLIFSFDKYILSAQVAPAQFAVYSQAFRIAAIFSMIVSSFNFAFGPLSMSLLNKKDAPEVFAHMRTFYLFIMCAAGAGLMACSKAVIALLSGQNYTGGGKFFAFFITGYIVYGLYSFAQLGILLSKKSYLGLYALSAGIITTIVLDMLLIGPMKGYGAALGFALGNIAMVFTADRLSKKYLDIKYRYAKDILIFLAFCCCAAISSAPVSIDNMYADGFVKLSLGAALFCAIVMLPVFRSDRNLFVRALKGAGDPA